MHQPGLLVAIQIRMLKLTPYSIISHMIIIVETHEIVKMKNNIYKQDTSLMKYIISIEVRKTRKKHVKLYLIQVKIARIDWKKSKYQV